MSKFIIIYNISKTFLVKKNNKHARWFVTKETQNAQNNLRKKRRNRPCRQKHMGFVPILTLFIHPLQIITTVHGPRTRMILKQIKR